MHEIIKSSRDLRMSTTEVAALTGKLAKHVNRDVKTILSKLTKAGIDTSAAIIERDGRGYITEVKMDKVLTMMLLVGYDITLQHAVVSRWVEMEESVAATGSYAADRWYNAGQMAEIFFKTCGMKPKTVSSGARTKLFNLRNSLQVIWMGGNPNQLEVDSFYIREDAYMMALAVMFDDIHAFHTTWIADRDYILSRHTVYSADELKGGHMVAQKASDPALSSSKYRRLTQAQYDAECEEIDLRISNGEDLDYPTDVLIID